MAEQEATKEQSEEERLKQMAAQMRAAEYKGLTEEEIQERERQKEMRRKKNVEILEDTLSILEKGSYEKAGQERKLQFTPYQMREIQVFLPEEIEEIRNSLDESGSLGKNKGGQAKNTSCTFSCENMDALVLAQRKYLELKEKGEAECRILVLNLASSTHPGGQTRKGASAQEEDLCRRTSLLLSLESETAKRYYDYNNARKTRMGSDGVMISPCVEVLKDASAEILSEPFPISVMSCAAPNVSHAIPSRADARGRGLRPDSLRESGHAMIRMGLEGMSQQEYETMLYNRIRGMLLAAASQGYRHLILGAFGCGVFGNDAAVVSDSFYRAITKFSYAGKGSDQLFESIDFAVLCRPEKDYNYREFCRYFSPRQL
ncbi:MAG: TIGR02452 family protein [Lachnospiraceae bacterium]|nr:TIGR02452 family protein [Lachnospiraceae bacterium]